MNTRAKRLGGITLIRPGRFIDQSLKRSVAAEALVYL
jgi:hypothetical protein